MKVKTADTQPQDKCVIRLKTTYWSDAKALHVKKSLTYLKRQCKNYNILKEDVSMEGADTVIERITNLTEVKDGVYEVITCNISRDWEGGYIDDYDFKLVPIEAPEVHP